MSRLDDVQHLLPATAQALIRLIGIVATLRLVEDMGGRQFPVSKNKRRLGIIRFEALAEVIGRDAAFVLTRHYGGDVLSVPTCAAALRELRDRELRADFDRITIEHPANHAVSVLQRKYKITERHVWRLLKRNDKQGPGDGQQMALF